MEKVQESQHRSSSIERLRIIRGHPDPSTQEKQSFPWHEKEKATPLRISLKWTFIHFEVSTNKNPHYWFLGEPTNVSSPVTKTRASSRSFVFHLHTGKDKVESQLINSPFRSFSQTLRVASKTFWTNTLQKKIQTQAVDNSKQYILGIFLGAQVKSGTEDLIITVNSYPDFMCFCHLS